jgi:ATP-dependent RNA helicase RhlE
VLVLSPTRELTNQIAESFKTYGAGTPLTVAIMVGGVKYGGQIRSVAAGVDVLVATPGRLLDHLGQGTVRLDETEVFVLDEADQMLDLGFVEPIRKVVKKLPARRQNLFFSATMPKTIGELANEILHNPQEVRVTPQATTVEKIAQTVMHVEASHKRDLLVELLADRKVSRALVFTRTKHGADKLVQYLDKSGLTASAIHGNKSQGQRERALAAFKDGKSPILVATDIAARGIDVDGVEPRVPVRAAQCARSLRPSHRRTARAGAEGVAITLCDVTERGLLPDIEKLTNSPSPRRTAAQIRAAPARRPPGERARRQAGQAPARPRQGSPSTRTARRAPGQGRSPQGAVPAAARRLVPDGRGTSGRRRQAGQARPPARRRLRLARLGGVRASVRGLRLPRQGARARPRRLRRASRGPSAGRPQRLPRTPSASGLTPLSPSSSGGAQRRPEDQQAPPSRTEGRQLRRRACWVLGSSLRCAPLRPRMTVEGCWRAYGRGIAGADGRARVDRRVQPHGHRPGTCGGAQQPAVTQRA